MNGGFHTQQSCLWLLSMSPVLFSALKLHFPWCLFLLSAPLLKVVNLFNIFDMLAVLRSEHEPGGVKWLQTRPIKNKRSDDVYLPSSHFPKFRGCRFQNFLCNCDKLLPPAVPWWFESFCKSYWSQMFSEQRSDLLMAPWAGLIYRFARGDQSAGFEMVSFHRERWIKCICSTFQFQIYALAHPNCTIWSWLSG